VESRAGWGVESSSYVRLCLVVVVEEELAPCVSSCSRSLELEFSRDTGVISQRWWRQMC